MVGIKEVAKKAGVSISTVSNVINQTKYVSLELRVKVEKAVKELSYEANPVARSMKSKKTGTIGVIAMDMCGTVYPYIVKGIYSVAYTKKSQIMLCDSYEGENTSDVESKEYSILKGLVNARVDGIIFTSGISEENMEDYLGEVLKMVNQEKYIPLVSIGRDFTQFGIDSVMWDEQQGAQKAVQHLIDCGCKNIGCILEPLHTSGAKKQFLGYSKTLHEAGLQVNETFETENAEGKHQDGYEKMKNLLQRQEKLDGVFVGNDKMAIGALKYLKEINRDVPEEIKVIGYGDNFLSGMMEPSLSSMDFDKRELGNRAAELLFQKINSEGPSKNADKIILESRLVIRESTNKGAF